MSFLNNLSSKLDGLNLGSESQARDYSDHRDYPPPSQQYGGSPAPDYGSGYRDQHQGSYSSPVPPPAAGPTYAPPPDKPPIPAGWVPQFDQEYQRWYYFEVATGRSQWSVPGYSERDNVGDERGWYPHGESGHESHGVPGYGHSSHSSHGYDSHSYESHGGHGGHSEYAVEEKKKKGGHGGLMMGVAGGLAVGAIGGALLADWHDDNEREEQERLQAAAASSYAPQSYAPPPEPLYNADGEYVDASDRESVASAREDYEEALAAAQDSDASSSEEEELEEAREEYEEEYEEAYDD
ncbi:hypothetical protein F4677DRAFT_90918 [Hypoxylon crocopeplum]|nr:hypothetical protein F4677DRAFT_90918 [Hypoxylon crocopeplum]